MKNVVDTIGDAGMFLNGRSKKVEMSRTNQAALKKVWNEQKVKAKEPVNHLGILQPDLEAGPRVGESLYPPAEPLYEVEDMSVDDVSSSCDPVT